MRSSWITYFAERNMKTSTMSTCRKSGIFPAPAVSCGKEIAMEGRNSDQTAGNPGRRYGGKNSLFIPLGSGRKGLPSKWEDAEKWILSPVTVNGAADCKNRALPPHCRRPKSKSGPLGCPAGLGYERPPFVQVSAANSPLMTGVLFADRGCCGSGSTGRVNGGSSSERSCSTFQSDICVVQPASAHAWESKVLDSSSTPTPQDVDNDIKKDAYPILPVVSVKDVATQMSPNSTISSSNPSPSPPKCNTISKSQSCPLECDVRDVQVDDHVTITRWSKKHVIKGFDRDSANIIRWKKKFTGSRNIVWEDSETVKCTTKEEIKITTWENFQKAKAEDAIQKLEMKLEKQRSSAMDKIHSKLKAAQRKAQEMRNMVTSGHTPRHATIDKSATFAQKTCRKISLSGWFSCHAF